jgi:isopenicillin-N N-acyltransferase-like protein
VLPIVEVTGNARERGRAHGEALRETVRHALEQWSLRTGSPRNPEDGAGRAAYLREAEVWTPGAVEELRGIAEGAGVRFDDVMELNLADERRLFGCSSAGVRRSPDGTPVSGQTMDTPAWFAAFRVAVRSAEPESGLTSLAFTIAGTPALCGVNSSGLAVWCNALYALARSPDGVPVSCVVRRLLSCRTLAEARSFVETVPHASGQHFLLASPLGLVSLECSGRSVVETRAGGSAVWHANHALANPDAAECTVDSNSLARDAFMAEALSAAGSAGDVCRILEDRTVPVCKTGDDRGDGYTLWAVVAEHRIPPSVLVSPGPPEPGSWEHVQL